MSIQARAAESCTDTYGTGSIQYRFRSRFENRFLGVYGLSVCGSLLSVAVRALGGMATDARASS